MLFKLQLYLRLSIEMIVKLGGPGTEALSAVFDGTIFFLSIGLSFCQQSSHFFGIQGFFLVPFLLCSNAQGLIHQVFVQFP